MPFSSGEESESEEEEPKDLEMDLTEEQKSLMAIQVNPASIAAGNSPPNVQPVLNP